MGFPAYAYRARSDKHQRAALYTHLCNSCCLNCFQPMCTEQGRISIREPPCAPIFVIPLLERFSSLLLGEASDSRRGLFLSRRVLERQPKREVEGAVRRKAR